LDREIQNCDGDPAVERANDLRLFIGLGGQMEFPNDRNFRP
jgi:hypothetical protein